MAVFVVNGVPLSADRIAWLEAYSLTQTWVRFDGVGEVLVDGTIANVQAAWEADISAPSVFAVNGTVLNADRIAWLDAVGVTQTRVLFDGTGQVVVDSAIADVQTAWEAAISGAPEASEPRYARSYSWATTTAGSVLGVGASAPATVGTLTTPILATTNARTRMRRTAFASSAIAGSLASCRHIQQDLHTSAGGSWRVQMCFAMGTLQTGMRAFHGVVDEVAAPTNIDPLTSSVRARIGLGCNASSGGWSVVHTAGGAAPTVIGLSASTFPIDTTTLYTLTLTGTPSQVVVTVENLTTGATVSHTLTTNLPSATTFLAPAQWACNNATAAAVAWDMAATVVGHGLLT